MEFDLGYFFEMPSLLTTIGVGLLILSVILLIFKGNKNTNVIKTNNPEELKQFMEQNNFPEEMIKNMTGENAFSGLTTTQTTRTVKYVNGQIVSDETHNINNNITPLTNCPNCGAKLEPGNNGVCRYCNTQFTTYQINQ